MMNRCATAILLAAALGLFVFASPASAVEPIAGPGEGAGQVRNPQGIAVDQASGRLYVVDRGNLRVDVFDSEDEFEMAFGWGVVDGSLEFQTCTAICRKGIAGPGKGQFTRPVSIAVDGNSVYVADDASFRVQKFEVAGPSVQFELMFGGGVNKTKVEEPGSTATERNVCTEESGEVCGAGSNGTGEGEFSTSGSSIFIDVNPEGTVYVADSQGEHPAYSYRVQRFEPSGSVIPPPPGHSSPILVEGEKALGLGADSGGDFYVASAGLSMGIRRYDADYDQVAFINSTGNGGVPEGLFLDDSTGRIYASSADGPDSNRGIVAYDSSGNTLRRFAYGIFHGFVTGMAVRGEDLYATDVWDSRVLALEFPPPGPIVLPEPCAPSSLGNIRATLAANVNPEGKETNSHFEYVDDVTYQQDVTEFGPGHGFDHALRAPESDEDDPIVGSDFFLHEVKVPVVNLVPETIYHCRVVAESEDGETTGEEGSFETLPPLEIGANWASDVDVEGAVLNAEVNPLGIQTGGYFEYVDDATYQEDVAELGPGHGFDHAARAPEEPEEVDFGAGESLKIGSVALSGLEPGTVYHYRVIATDPFFPEGFQGPEHTFRTFSGGDGSLSRDRAYELVSPARKNSAEVAIPGNAGGFSSENFVETQSGAASSGEAFTYTSWTSFASPQGAPGASQYLSKRTPTGWTTENVSPFGFQRNPLIPSYRGFTPDLGFAGLVATEPPLTSEAQVGIENLYLRNNATGELQALTIEAPHFTPVSEQGLQNFCAGFAGASPDGQHAFFAANGALAGAPEGPGFSLYEWSPKGLALVSVLPNGVAAAPSVDTAFGGRSARCSAGVVPVANAVSDDQQRVFWTYGGKYKTSQSPLLARLNGSETVQLDIAKGGPGPSGQGRFLAATSDGSYAFFSAPGRLTASAPEGGSLYRYDTVTREATSLIGGAGPPAGVLGVLGISEAGDYSYFVAKGVLTGEEVNAQGDKALADRPNLYLWHEGEGLRFIATLADEDATNWSAEPIAHTSRVSPDGRHLAFVSIEAENLVDYDSTVANGIGCKLASEGGGALQGSSSCAEVFLYNAEADTLTCASCNPSGARPLGPSFLPAWSNPYEGPRYLSDDGSRLFFSTFDALSPADENEKRDVYVFEHSSGSACDAESPSFDPASDGCLQLISSGKSEDESYLRDASADGRDVFFATRERLVGWDDNENYDVYDARVGGGLPAPPVSPPICQGEGCRPPITPAPSTPSAPTSNFSGPGNTAEKPKKAKKKGKRATKGKKAKKGKAKVRKHREQRKGKHERAQRGRGSGR